MNYDNPDIPPQEYEFKLKNIEAFNLDDFIFKKKNQATELSDGDKKLVEMKIKKKENFFVIKLNGYLDKGNYILLIYSIDGNQDNLYDLLKKKLNSDNFGIKFNIKRAGKNWFIALGKNFPVKWDKKKFSFDHFDIENIRLYEIN